MSDAVDSCRRAIEADPALYKQVAGLAPVTGGLRPVDIHSRRAYAEFGEENLNYLLAVIKKVKEDRKWRPAGQVILRAC